MTFNISVLLITTLLAGLAVLLIPKLNIHKFRMLLSFSGAYLFSITVIHILPELFHEAANMRLTGAYVLAGFFLQMILEYFSSGVEHGHIHLDHNHEHAHHSHLPYSMFISLCLHSFLEGTLLMHPFHTHAHEGSQTLLIGLVLHKIPESFALISILIFGLKNKYLAIALLIVYSLCSPAGLITSDLLFNELKFNETIFQFLFAIVAGNFLYISTTIFFETSPDHKFKISRLVLLILAAVMAIVAEVVMG
ncbi:MAG TPA: ZIP family metal transporter [Cytophagaceae bacterium]|jgi:zinc and cadmium transporter|nr:ZIP family metal transporter [Cytophagaceae bacterium]